VIARFDERQPGPARDFLDRRAREIRAARFKPVPTAVPPSGKFVGLPSTLRGSAPPTPPPCLEYPLNSCPSRIGTASCRCVRPILTISWNCAAFDSSEICNRPIAGRQATVRRLGSGDMDRRRNHVVAGLSAIHIVIRGALRARPGDHLIGVHISRGAAAGLEDVQHELRNRGRPPSPDWRLASTAASPFTLAAAALINPSAGG